METLQCVHRLPSQIERDLSRTLVRPKYRILRSSTLASAIALLQGTVRFRLLLANTTNTSSMLRRTLRRCTDGENGRKKLRTVDESISSTLPLERQCYRHPIASTSVLPWPLSPIPAWRKSGRLLSHRYVTSRFLQRTVRINESGSAPV